MGVEPRVLLVGDLMTDVIVRPEGPLPGGSDRRAKIRFEPGSFGARPGGVGPPHSALGSISSPASAGSGSV